MRPTLPRGSRVLVELCDASACRPGDLVLVWDAGRPVLHRLVLHARDRVVTWGDNLATPDRAVSASALTGRAIEALDADGRTLPLRRTTAMLTWIGKAGRAVARRLLLRSKQ